MTILALEASSLTAGVALHREGKLLGQSYQDNGRTHSQTLLPMCKSLLDNTGVKASEIGLIAVTNGPGSFTGLRIGVSTAAGLALGWGLPCVGVSSLEAAAMGVAHMGGLICAVMDARRGQFYNALFAAKSGAGGSLSRLTPDRVISNDALMAEIAKKTPVMVGDGARLCYNRLAADDFRAVPDNMLNPCAWAVAVLAGQAAARGEAVPPGSLRPVYLRPSPVGVG